MNKNNINNVNVKGTSGWKWVDLVLAFSVLATQFDGFNALLTLIFIDHWVRISVHLWAAVHGSHI